MTATGIADHSFTLTMSGKLVLITLLAVGFCAVVEVQAQFGWPYYGAYAFYGSPYYGYALGKREAGFQLPEPKPIVPLPHTRLEKGPPSGGGMKPEKELPKKPSEQ